MNALFRDYGKAFYADTYQTRLEGVALKEQSLHRLVCKGDTVVKIERGSGFRGRVACWIEDNVLSPFKQFNVSEKSRKKARHFYEKVEAATCEINTQMWRPEHNALINNPEQIQDRITNLVKKVEYRTHRRQPMRVGFVNEIMNEIMSINQETIQQFDHQFNPRQGGEEDLVGDLLPSYQESVPGVPAMDHPPPYEERDPLLNLENPAAPNEEDYHLQSSGAHNRQDHDNEIEGYDLSHEISQRQGGAEHQNFELLRVQRQQQKNVAAAEVAARDDFHRSHGTFANTLNQEVFGAGSKYETNKERFNQVKTSVLEDSRATYEVMYVTNVLHRVTEYYNNTAETGNFNLQLHLELAAEEIVQVYVDDIHDAMEAQPQLGDRATPED